MIARPAVLARLGKDRRGAVLVEFAILCPVLLLLLMGLGDTLYQAYAQSILDGALQKAARDSTIEAAPTATIDAKVVAMVQTIAKNATFTSTRKSYDNFSEVAPEPFTDTNGNGICDAGESYTDENANNQWDADPGVNGQGGASDVTLYTMTITYPRLFPVARLFGWPSSQTISAQTLLMNQPFAIQTTTPTATLRCT